MEPSSPEERILLELAAFDVTHFRDALRHILKLDAQLLNVERVNFWFIERQPLSITCEEGYLATPDRFERGQRLLAEEYPRYFDAIYLEQVIAANNARTDPRTRDFADSYLEPLGISSMLDAPVWLRGSLAGILCHEHVGPPREWTSHEKQLAVFVAQSLARVLLARLQSRATFLSDGAMLLGGTLDIDEVPRRLARLTVPLLGDWCIIDVREMGNLQRLAATHADPDNRELLEELEPPRAAPLFAIVQATETGRPVLLRDVTPERLRELCRDRRQAELLEALGARTLMAVPLIAHGETMGAMAFGAGEDHPSYRSDDLELARELSERAAIAIENARLHNQLGRALRLRDEFLAVAAHELNTPLSSLQLAFQGLSSEKVELSSEDARRTIQIAERQLRRLRRLVEDLLSITNLRAGRLALDLAEVDLAEVVRDLVHDRQEQIERSGSPVQVETPEPVVGLWDRERLNQVVSNLLSNALKFGHGEAIRIAVSLQENRGRLTIQNRGITIEQDQLQRIFDPFHRAVSPRQYGGLGLGLFIVRQLVEALGGTVRGESSPTVGSIFTIELPLSGPLRPGEEREGR